MDGHGPVSIPAVVVGWAETVKTERGLPTGGARPSVASALAYLAAHVDHLAGAEWIGDAVDELAAVARACRAVACGVPELCTGPPSCRDRASWVTGT
ncbi:hypothetical protein [Saccharothrix deserti]|uniref:hypothetical protein n=1 Tax=Saccharothrix deserti TaxID=2593674 RepID=UPI00131D86C0|nr:hypothetical protein [Saccharothrix deserti]